MGCRTAEAGNLVVEDNKAAVHRDYTVAAARRSYESVDRKDYRRAAVEGKIDHTENSFGIG